jgi:hypothetical protein
MTAPQKPEVIFDETDGCFLDDQAHFQLAELGQEIRKNHFELEKLLTAYDYAAAEVQALFQDREPFEGVPEENFGHALAAVEQLMIVGRRLHGMLLEQKYQLTSLECDWSIMNCPNGGEA